MSDAKLLKTETSSPRSKRGRSMRPMKARELYQNDLIFKPRRRTAIAGTDGFDFSQIDEKIREQNNRKAKSSFIIDSQGKFKKAWDSLTMICMIFTTVYLPIKLSFFFDKSSTPGVQVIERVIDGIYFVDMLMNFFIPFYDDNELVYSHASIAKNYLCRWFTLDLASIVPFEDILRAASSVEDMHLNLKFIVFFRLFKIFQVAKLVLLMQAFKSKSDYANYLILGAKYLLDGTVVLAFLPSIALITVTIHLSSCIWYAVGYLNIQNDNWIVVNGFADQSLLDNYIAACYFVVQTLTTVGYGDIGSRNNQEMFIRVCIIIVGMFIYSVFTGEVMDYQSKNTSKMETFLLKKEKLEKISDCFDLSAEFEDRIMRQFILQRDQPDDDGTNLKKIRNELNSSANETETDQLFYNIYRLKFQDFPIFNACSNPNYILELGRAAEHGVKTFDEGEVIYNANEPPACFYIILDGTVSFEEKGLQNLPFLKIKSGHFGEYELLNNEHRHFTATAMTETRVFCIQHKEFKKIFVNGPDQAFCNSFKEAAENRFRKILQAHKWLKDEIIAMLKLKQAGLNPNLQKLAPKFRSSTSRRAESWRIVQRELVAGSNGQGGQGGRDGRGSVLPPATRPSFGSGGEMYRSPLKLSGSDPKKQGGVNLDPNESPPNSSQELTPMLTPPRLNSRFSRLQSNQGNHGSAAKPIISAIPENENTNSDSDSQESKDYSQQAHQAQEAPRLANFDSRQEPDQEPPHEDQILVERASASSKHSRASKHRNSSKTSKTKSSPTTNSSPQDKLDTRTLNLELFRK